MNEQISIEEFIRTRAAMNWSRRMVRDALGVTRYRFETMCQLMPDVKWAPQGMSVGNREADAARRGVSTPKLRESARRAKMARYACARQLTVCSFTGSVTQQIEHWGEFITVSPATIRRRLVNGMSDLDALFLPPSETCAKTTKGGYWSRK